MRILVLFFCWVYHSRSSTTQALINAQKEADSQRDVQMSQMTELRHNLDDMSRKWDKSDRTSENIVDEFHQLKNKVDMQVANRLQVIVITGYQKPACAETAVSVSAWSRANP